MIAHVMCHDCVHGATEVGGHEGPLAGRSLPPLFADFFGESDGFTAAEVHDEFPVLIDPGASPGDGSWEAFAGEGSAREGEIAGGLAVAVDALEALLVVVEGVGGATAGVEEDPEEAAVVFPAPADVVEHDGIGEALGVEEPLHHLHGHEVALVGLGAGDDGMAVSLGPGVRVEEAFGEVAGGEEVEEAELILPAQAVGGELVDEVKDGEVAAELGLGGLGGEVPRTFSFQWKETPRSWTNLKASSTRFGVMAAERSTSQAWSTLCSEKPMG